MSDIRIILDENDQDACNKMRALVEELKYKNRYNQSYIDFGKLMPVPGDFKKVDINRDFAALAVKIYLTAMNPYTPAYVNDPQKLDEAEYNRCKNLFDPGFVPLGYQEMMAALNKCPQKYRDELEERSNSSSGKEPIFFRFRGIDIMEAIELGKVCLDNLSKYGAMTKDDWFMLNFGTVKKLDCIPFRSSYYAKLSLNTENVKDPIPNSLMRLLSKKLGDCIVSVAHGSDILMQFRNGKRIV